MSLRDLPTLNAILNAASAALLLLGYGFIRRRRVTSHRWCMIGALAMSALFLASYLSYHAQVGSVRFPLTGGIRVVYLAVLATHSILAACVPPLALVTLSRALRGRFAEHRRIARWTLPIWLYVSLTGVVVYWMLYHLAGAS
ncbi:MAG: DUF420 domain-containing protein [Deltaproteobacteria bacterium]|nr:DUF420 domain-containing protein [Deltaproteobacteria bacterium]